MEIAKYRAARLLWSNIVNAYNPKNEKSCRMYIHSVTSDWNKTIYDPYVNMLRSTTESMSSILGCVDSHTVKPFNSVFNIPGEFSERIARNTQIILKEEAYFDKIVDPAGGSYYIESLTQSIAEQAWKLFLETEKEGGYTKAFKKGIVQNRIEASANKKLEALSTRKETIVGTNQYPNYNEHVKTSIIPELLKYPVAEGSDLVAKPVKRFRAACNFEDLRLRTEKHKSGRPKVFLLTCGNLSMRRARAQFAGNFFACAGYEIIDNNGFKTIDAGIKAALENKAAIVVLCSSDDDYATIAPEANEKLKDKAILVVAGSPSSMDELKAKGIKHFVHLRSNLLETLSEFHKELGIK